MLSKELGEEKRMCHKHLNEKVKDLRITGAKPPVLYSRNCLELRGKERREKAAGDNTMGGLFLRGGP